ncbi:rhodanese-like domain-containing protein [Neisseria chenwenguii]|uniref:Rhodanese-like domain-containing protein n=1 Tax=Neisseria chenwenguii TaxID=1853278 RepID=A0A220S140_9NEIS|nr:rhodanese-like domain-containing protein [Neisseria chenwenguii]ASK27122.1 rhodanese-like domain-containing protein [Neisseria chenwenguii]ROV54873.1 rhodanese-like domain-containing protein [Neisseria chenwenguii]
MKKLLTAIVLAAVAATPAVGLAKKPAAEKAAAAQPVRAKGVWIDVRTPEEFAEGHLSGAINVPADQIAAQIAKISPDKNAPVNLYCRSGRRAEAALQQLKAMGYTNLTNHGGYQDLLKKGIK